MHDLLAVARRSASEQQKQHQQRPSQGGGGRSSSIATEFLGFTLASSISFSITSSSNNGARSSSVERRQALALAGLATLRAAALRSFALAVAFASRSSIFLLATWLAVETGVRVAVLLSYAAWCFIFVMGTATTTFAWV